MTVNNSANKVIAAGNGVQTVFNFSFIAVNASDISVIFTDASGNETTLATAQYTLTLNPVPPGQLWALGGSVTYPLVGSPIALNTSLTIVRTLSLTQLVSLSNQGNTFPSAVETAIDLIEMQLQQVSELFQRAIVAPVVDPNPPLPLPPAAQRANQALVFDGSGNPIAGALPASGVISTAMQPVVGAATLAVGRAAFGLGGMAVEGIGAGLQDDGSGNARRNSIIQAVATNQAIHAASHLVRYVATGPITFTLDRANTLWNGFGFWVEAYVGAVTLAINAADSFKGSSSGNSVTIPPGTAAFITTDAATSGTWYIEATQASAAPVTGGSFVGLAANNDGVTPNTKWNFSAAELVITNLSGGAVRVSNPSISIDATTNGPNGLDTGTLAANTWYYWFFIANHQGSVAGLMSLSPTAPTLPSGYTFVKRLGAVPTDGSAHFKLLLQRGRNAQYQSELYPIITSNVQVFGAFSTAASIAPTSYKMKGILAFTGGNTAAASVFSTNAGAIPVAQIEAVNSTTQLSIAIPFECIQEVASTIYYSAGPSIGPLGAADLYAVGWEDSI